MKDSFYRYFLTLMAGSFIAQCLSILSAPILSRLFNPVEFGSYAFYLSIASVGAVIATGKFEIAILIPKENEKGVDLAHLALMICLGFSFFILVIIVLFSSPILALIPYKNASAWLYLIPLSIFMVSAYQVFYYLANRHKQYSRISWSRIGQAASAPLLSIFLGLKGLGVTALVTGQIFGSFIANCILPKPWFNRRPKEFAATPGWITRSMQAAVQYRNYPLHNIPAGLFNTLGHQIPVLLLGSFFNLQITGFFYFSYRLVNLPMNLFGSALADISYRKTMEIIHQDGSLKEYMEKTVSILILVSIIPALILFFSGGPLFSLAFGPQWRKAGIYTQILVPFFFMRFLSSPVTIFYQKKRTDLLLQWQFIFFIAISLGVILGGLLLSDTATVGLISLLGSACYFWLILMNFRLAGARFRNSLKNVKFIIKSILHEK